MHYRRLILKSVLIAGVALLLTSCEHFSSSGSADSSSGKKVSGTACAGNAYLQKYGCSARRIKQAARSGDPDAQYALGYMYYYGIGTSQDRQTARLWIKRSAAQGQPLARKADDLLAGGGHLNTLHGRQHRAAITGSSQYYSGGSNNSDSRNDSDGDSDQSQQNSGISEIKHHEPTPDVKTLNSQVPNKPLSDILPGYGKQQDSNQPKLKIRSLQKKSEPSIPSQNNSDTSGGPEPSAEPLTHYKDPRLSPVSSPVSALAHARTEMTAAEKAMLTKPGRYYTLQLMGGSNLAAIKAFIAENNLQGKAHYYSAKLNHKQWYMLVYGDYPTAMRAHSAAQQLPAKLRALHPWVKSYRIVQKQIRHRKIVL